MISFTKGAIKEISIVKWLMHISYHMKDKSQHFGFNHCMVPLDCASVCHRTKSFLHGIDRIDWYRQIIKSDEPEEIIFHDYPFYFIGWSV